MMDETSYQISLLTALNNKLKKDENMYRLICKTSDNVFIYYNYAEKRTVQVGNWSHFFEFSQEEYKSYSQIIECMEDTYKLQVYECMTLEKRKKEKEIAAFKQKDKGIWIELESNVIYDQWNNPVEKIFCFKDITKFKLQNDELSYMAYYDSITGLYNRNYFVKNLQEMLGKAGNEGNCVSVLFIDIDDFRKINDGMGMLIGDEVVQLFGQTLKEFSQENILVSHFNSDIFCIAVYDPCGNRSADHIIATIKSRLSGAYRLSNGAEITISISIGIAEYPEASDSAVELINCAEIVMFKAKHLGKNRVQYFDAPIIREFKENITIEQEMTYALRDEKFFMYYQPQYDTQNKRLRGVEALVRWRDEKGEMISPGTFIPLAEKNGTILPLGEWIMEESISDFSTWYRKYQFDNLILSINISALQFKNKNFINNLAALLKKYDVPAYLIELEITESVLIEDMQDIVNKMNILRGMGIRFSMDDFGTGFSSLSYLRTLPIDTLKIDKSFIDTVVTDGPTRTIAEAIIELGKKLGFDTIAEGVEEEVQFRLLKKIGCENIQGFYLGKPMDHQQIEELLQEKS